jgi:hypothetical protein
MDRHGVTHQRLGGLGELRGGLELAVGVDDLGPALALGLDLLGYPRRISLFAKNPITRGALSG